MIDYAAAQRLFVRYKSRLTRLQNQQNHRGIIALWDEMQTEFDRLGFPLPDDWRRWERAAEDAQFSLRRAQETRW